jgi:uracil-DNA glycosylase
MQENINQIKKTLKLNFKDSGWDNILNPFLDSKEFDAITNTLIYLVEQNRRFTPKFKDTFNPFIETKYKDLKVVIVNQEPYPQLGIADGLAFSCSKTGKPQPSLKYILKELGDEDGDVDLSRWANQGVLLINTSATCELNKTGLHYSIWKPFIEYLFRNINENNENIVFVLMGRKAEIWQLLLSKQKILKCPHPASAAYKNDIWNADGIFEKINKELNRQDKTCINW